MTVSAEIGRFEPPRRAGGAWKAAAAPAAYAFNARLAFYVALIFCAGFLGPIEAAVRVGLTLTTLRVALIMVCVIALFELARKLVRGGYVPVLSDFFVLLFTGWVLVGLAVTDGLKGVASPLGFAAVEFLIAYLVGRTFFGTPSGLDEFMKVLAGLAIVLVLLGVVDFLAHDNVLTGLAAKYFGFNRTVKIGDKTFYNNAYYRFGMVRARATFEHAILYGTFFAVAAPMFFYLMRTHLLRAALLAVAVTGVALSLSSAPFLGLLIAFACIGFDSGFNRSSWRWSVFILAVVYVAALYILLADDPLGSLISGFTFNPQTGFYRVAVWSWIGYNLEPSPWFGVGLRDWLRLTTMLDSVDSLWLTQALRHGYGGLALLLLTIVGSFFVWTPRALTRHPIERSGLINTALAIALLECVFIAFTVHYWGKMWAFLALLVGIRAGLSEARYLPPRVRGDAPTGPQSIPAGSTIGSPTLPIRRLRPC